MIHCTYQGVNCKNFQIIKFLKIVFILEKSVHPDEELQNMAYGLQKCLFRGFQSTKG